MLIFYWAKNTEIPFLKWWMVIMICMSWPFHALLAQAPALSLEDAVQIGLSNNFDIRIERMNVDITKNNNTWAETGILPSLTFSLAQANTYTKITNPASFLQGQIENHGVNPILALNWVLFDGFKVQTNSQRLANLQKESEGNAAIVVQNAVQAIILGYYKAVYHKQRTEVLQKTLKLSKDKFDYVSLKKELGSAVATEVLLEEGNYLTDSTNYVNQQRTYRDAIRGLNILLGKDEIDQDYTFVNTLDIKDKEFTQVDLLNKLENNNANLQKEYLTQAILRNNVDLAYAAYYPTLSFNANYSYNLNSQDLSNASFSNGNSGPEIPSTARTSLIGFTFNLTFNLFNGGKITRAIQNAMTQESMGQLRVERLKQSLSRDVLSALDLYNVRKQLRSISARNREASELTLELSGEQFKTGSINSFNYRDVQVRNQLASLNELDAIYNLIESYTSLMRLSGSILDDQTGN